MRRDYMSYLRKFREAKWDEEFIFELSVPGKRGVLLPVKLMKMSKKL